MPVSTKVLAGIAIIMLVIGAGIGYGISAAMMPAPTTTPTAPSGLSGTIPIGAIMPLSGDLADYGATAKAATEIAQAEINNFTTASGAGVSFNFLIEDSTTTSSVTLTAVQSFAAKGVKVIVGGLDSGDLETISQYVESNQIVVISGESSAPRSAVGTGVDNGSYIFRTIPAGDSEGFSITQAFMSLGYKYVAAITAQRTYTEAIYNVFQSVYTAAGGTILANVEYAPGTTDYTAQLDALETAVKPYNSSQVAIFCNTFSEAAQILSQAQQRNSPLLNLRWIGQDSITLETVITTDAGGPASKVKLTGLEDAAPSSPAYSRVVAGVEAKIGVTPDVYAIAMYDADWIAVLSILAAGKYDGPAIRAVVPFIADRYFGGTGNVVLKANGDRANMDQEFYSVEMVNGTATWVDTGHYDSASNTFKWLGT